MSALKPPSPRPGAQTQPADHRPGEDVASLPPASLPVPRDRDPGRLRPLADAARQAVEPDERLANVTALVDLLVALRAPGNEPAEAKSLLELLDAKLLHDLEDAHGRSARREAVETLTTLGFPWALHVAPDDLRFARDWTGPTGASADTRAALTEWERRLRSARIKAAVLCTLGQLGAFAAEAARRNGPPQLALVALVAVLSSAATIAWAARRPSMSGQVAYGMTLLLAAVGSVLLVTLTGLAGFLSLGGVMLAASAAFGWQAESVGSDPASLQRDYDAWRERNPFR